MLLAYFLPTVIAVTKARPNKGAIFGLNLLLGWTAIGWIVALIWSLTSGRQVVAPVVMAERQPFLQSSAQPEPQKRCPACAELVHRDAMKCKHCGEAFGTSKAPEPQRPLAVAQCPGCGKLRVRGILKCVYCGNTEEVK
jgi:ribosomal protein L37AE/L43A